MCWCEQSRFVGGGAHSLELFRGPDISAPVIWRHENCLSSHSGTEVFFTVYLVSHFYFYMFNFTWEKIQCSIFLLTVFSFQLFHLPPLIPQSSEPHIYQVQPGVQVNRRQLSFPSINKLNINWSLYVFLKFLFGCFWLEMIPVFFRFQYNVVCFQSSMDAPEAWTPPFNFGMLRVAKDVKENSPEDHIFFLYFLFFFFFTFFLKHLLFNLFFTLSSTNLPCLLPLYSNCKIITIAVIFVHT